MRGSMRTALLCCLAAALLAETAYADFGPKPQLMVTVENAPEELIVAFVEAGAYRKVLKGCSKRRAFLYGLTANAVSAIVGWYLIEPLWQWTTRVVAFP